MRNRFLFVVSLLAFFSVSAQAARLPERVLTTTVCERYLLGEKGRKMAATVTSWLNNLPPTELWVERIPVLSMADELSTAPYEFFSDENQGRPLEEVELEYLQRWARAKRELREGFAKYQPLTRDQAKEAARAQAEAHDRQSLAVLERVALGLPNEAALTLGEIKHVSASGDGNGHLLLTVHGQSGVLGSVELLVDSLRLGFGNSVASWQAHRFMEDPFKFPQLARGSVAVRRFMGDQGYALLQLPSTAARRVGFLMDYSAAAQKDGSALHLSVVIVRDCERAAVAKSEILFPVAQGVPGALNLCLVETGLTLRPAEEN